MFTKITALTLAAVAYVNAQAFANVEDRAFLNDFELYPTEKRLEQNSLTNDTINNNDPKFDWKIIDQTVNQTRNATINNHGSKFELVLNESVSAIRGWGPDYFGSAPVTNEIKFKCNLLVDFMYFYNLVPLHGDEHIINSKTD